MKRRRGGPAPLPRDKDTTLKRLLANRVISVGDCWEWDGCKNGKGYGLLSFGRRAMRVHRLIMWILHDFDLKSELLVLHKCDNPPCFNPKHLFFGTNLDNQRDFWQKGKSPHRVLKTHCPAGHEYTPENSIVRRGTKECRECRRLYQMRRRHG